ncbi:MULTISPECIES: Crp/Fnr family transcriptional regulator [Enterocloster]|uniref:cAMP-binding domain of CRP or a regulatory subunit of cAMP-dependent protein kinases n=1 Tax=Enterocloster lavalensis TaxID=460384 RepID=A0A1I0D0K6_9FIRM|nr:MULTISPECIES: Crp/Fnr family transcriptional regulator [Enterocloster]MDR3756012.1 Crp/Fnr family transcriptional regulator [Enterocloster sp.]PST32832.1 Crp/Fnr family transcriptional regulator [Enterocloster lavalensis]SET24939.1 cAMP-binding domain of CRP or a regulatory subunit of cAMP-dependent protein kinases [Enterocloster lavalensis]
MTCSEAIRQSAVLGSASASGREALAAFGCLKKYGRGEHIFRDKEEASALYFLVEGMASLYKINSLGEKKVIFAYGPGNLLNEEMLQNLPASVSCEAKENSLVFMIPRERLWTVMERDPALTRAVVQSMALKIRRLYRQLKNTTNALSGEKRLAAKLFKLGRDYGVETEKGTLIDMNLSITYLADMLGSKRETVSRQAKKLTELQLISMEKNHVSIPDMEKLREYFKQP